MLSSVVYLESARPNMDYERTATKWLKWLETIEREITWLAIHRHIFLETQKIITANTRIQKPSAFYTWMRMAYVTDITVGIRRQLSRDADAISLWKLLEELATHPQVMSRRRFVALYKGSSVERFADEDFNRFAGKGGLHVDVLLVRKDQKRLEALWNVVKKYVNRRIAHTDKRDVAYLPTFNDLDRCQDLLEELLKRYVLLFRASSLVEILPTFQDDWQAIFREPWIVTEPEEEQKAWLAPPTRTV